MAQKIKSSTQNFTEVTEIADDAVVFQNHNACSILEVSSVNFFLLSQDEQNARIYGYMSLLNSLSFPIQIVIVSKRVDMSQYLKLIDGKITNTQNPRAAEQLTLYKEFIQELIKGEGLLDKKIYVVIPFSPLELGPITKGVDYMQKLREVLATKRANLMSQIERIGLSSRVVSGESLAKLFYELFNDDSVNIEFDQSDVKNIII